MPIDREQKQIMEATGQHTSTLIRDPTKFYMALDTSFETFFAKKEYNLENFKFYLQILIKNEQIDQLPTTLVKMDKFNIKPDSTIYSIVMSAYAKAKKFKEVMALFESVKNNSK